MVVVWRGADEGGTLSLLSVGLETVLVVSESMVSSLLTLLKRYRCDEEEYFCRCCCRRRRRRRVVVGGHLNGWWIIGGVNETTAGNSGVVIMSVKDDDKVMKNDLGEVENKSVSADNVLKIEDSDNLSDENNQATSPHDHM